MKKNINIQQVCFFFLKKIKPKKQKKVINISPLTTILRTLRLLILLVLSHYELAYKYGIIFQISIYNWMQNCVF